MKKIIIAIALMTSACTSQLENSLLKSAPLVGNVCTAAEGTLIDEKVVYAAEVLYNIPAHAYVTADQNGNLTPELKAKAKPLLIKLNSLRNAIFAAKGSVNCDFQSMKDLHVEVLQLLPARN